MKKIFDLKGIIIALLTITTIFVVVNPKGIMPNRTKIVPQIDSIPYAVHDTISVDSLVEVEVEVPVPYEVEKRVEVPVIQSVDTLEIMKVYFAKVPHKDVLMLPNNQGTVTITDTISKNAIVNRKFISDIKKMIVKDTIYTKEPKVSQLYLGVDAKFNQPDVMQLLGVSVLLKDKSEKLYKLGIGVSNKTNPDGLTGRLDPYIGGGVYWPIKKFK
jgi:hypothetical protein